MKRIITSLKEDNISVMNVTKALLGVPALLGTKEPTWRNLMNVIHVGRPFVWAQPWFCIREFTLGRNPTLVTGVLKVLVGVQILLNIGESTLAKNHINVVNVGKPSVKVQILLYTRESTQEKNPTNAVIVVKVLANAQTWLNIKEYTLEKSLIFVTSVTSISVRVLML